MTREVEEAKFTVENIVYIFIRIYLTDTMSKRETRDPYATVCLSRLTKVLDLDVLEVFQSLEDSGFVLSNLAVEAKFKPHRSFLAKSSEKLNKIINRKGKWMTIHLYYNKSAVPRAVDFPQIFKKKFPQRRCSKMQKIDRELLRSTF